MVSQPNRITNPGHMAAGFGGLAPSQAVFSLVPPKLPAVLAKRSGGNTFLFIAQRPWKRRPMTRSALPTVQGGGKVSSRLRKLAPVRYAENFFKIYPRGSSWAQEGRFAASSCLAGTDPHPHRPEATIVFAPRIMHSDKVRFCQPKHTSAQCLSRSLPM